MLEKANQEKLQVQIHNLILVVDDLSNKFSNIKGKSLDTKMDLGEMTESKRAYESELAVAVKQESLKLYQIGTRSPIPYPASLLKENFDKSSATKMR